MQDAHDWVRGRELAVLHALGIQWTPGARRHICCPFPDHDDDHPSWRWDSTDSRWFCSASCGNGSVFDAVIRMRGGDFKDAIRFVREVLEGTLPIDGYSAQRQSLPRNKSAVNQKTKTPAVHMLASTPPRDADLEARTHIAGHDTLPDGWHSLGKPKAWWMYLTAEREIFEIRARYDGLKVEEITGKLKEVLPWIWDGKKWRNKAAPAPRPLYRLPELLSAPDAPVLFVEGEKTADRGGALFQDFVTTTTSGGSNQHRSTDYSPLKGRKVTIWPDNDHPYQDKHGAWREPAGSIYAAAIAQHAHDAGAVEIYMVDVPKDWPDKWDLADEPPSDSVDLRAMLEDARPWQPPQQPAPLAPKPAPSAPAAAPLQPAASAAAKPDKDAEPFTFPIPTPFKWIDPKLIPPRGFIYGTHFVRKYVSCTIAPTKTGKTSLLIAEAIAIVTGKPILDITPRETGNVWLWNGEDPRDDLQARVSACMLAHGVDPEEVEGRLFVDSGRDQPLVLTHQTKAGNIIAEPVEKHLVQYLGDLKILAASVDPFVSSHRIPENDNTLMDMVAKTWARIADRANCAIDLVHHTRKNHGGEVSGEDARGASALLSAVRGSRVLNRMTKDQAAEFHVKEGTHRRYFWVGGADSSLAPPTDDVRWHQIVTVHLGNDDPEGIGAVRRWRPAGLMDDFTVEDVRLVQAQIANGIWRENSQSKEWAGRAIATALDLDLEDDAERKRISKMLWAWLKGGVLRIVSRSDDKSRRLKKFVEVGQAV